MRRKKNGEISKEKTELPTELPAEKKRYMSWKSAAKTLRQTIEEVWRRLQVDEETALYFIAQENPKWFYELCKGMFPKDLFIQTDLNINTMSPKEIKAEIVRLLADEPELIQALQISSTTEET